MQTRTRPKYEPEDSLNNSVNLTRYSSVDTNTPREPLLHDGDADESDVIIWDDPDVSLPQEPLHGGDDDDKSNVIIWDDPDQVNVDQQEATDTQHQHQLPCQHQHSREYDKKETKSTSSSVSISSADDDDGHDHEDLRPHRLTIRDGIQIKVIDGGELYVCRPSLTSKDLLFVDFGCARDSFCSASHHSSAALSLSASVHDHEDARLTRKPKRSVQFAPIPQVHAVESFLTTGVWYTESDLDAFQRQKEKDIAMIKVLQRFSGASGSRRGSMDSFSSGSRRASVESNPNSGSSRRGSVESSSGNNNNTNININTSSNNNLYDPMADYAKMRLEKANTTPMGLENHVCSKLAIGERNPRRVEHLRAVLGEQKRQRSLGQQHQQQQQQPQEKRGGMPTIKTFFKTYNTTATATDAATATTSANIKQEDDQQVERIAEISSTYSELSRKRAEVNGTLHAENDCCKIIRAGHQMSRMGVSARTLSARRLSIGEVSGGPSLPTPPSA